MPPDPDWLRPAQAARLLGCSTRHVCDLADRGLLPCRRTPGGHRRFRRADVERLAKECGAAGQGVADGQV